MKYERTNGEMHNIEPTILSKTEDGQFDVHTRFFMHRPEDMEK